MRMRIPLILVIIGTSTPCTLLRDLGGAPASPDYFPTDSTTLRSGSAITPIHDSANVYTEAQAYYYNDQGISISVQKDGSEGTEPEY